MLLAKKEFNNGAYCFSSCTNSKCEMTKEISDALLNLVVDAISVVLLSLVSRIFN